jgi:hypothetical protein
MAQRRHHYERAFEAYLRHRRMPYVAVDEAKKALLPEDAPLRVEVPTGQLEGEPTTSLALKSFDFVIYGQQQNLLVDVKGRKVVARRPKVLRPEGSMTPLRARLESWVTREDIDAMEYWQALFGAGFLACFVFVYWCDEQPPDGLFQEIFDYQGRWYALRAVTLGDYARSMKQRSPRWGTVDLPSAVFERLSQPFGPAWLGSVG